MEIILIQDVQNLGYKDDIVTVKDGYANNYLLPGGYALMATPSNRKVLAENIRQRAFKEEKIRKDAEALFAKLNDVTVKIAAKAGANGQIFGSVNNIQVAEAVKSQFDMDIDRRKIFVDGEKIKEIGSYTAIVSIYKEVKAEIKLDVFAE